MASIGKKYSSILPLCMVVCLSLIAQVGAAEPRIIWNEQGAKIPPRNIYDYQYKGSSGYDVSVVLDTAEIDAAPYYMAATFTADEGAKGGAGFGFYWNADEDFEPRVSTTISAYSGVCLNYSATNPIRMDFKQEDIDDDNYFGILLPKTNGARMNKFVAFDELKMGWKGSTTWKWNARKQLGLQFSYKSDQVKKYGTENQVGIYMMMYADECPQHLPVVKPDAPVRVELEEGDKYYLRLSDIFFDEDGDSLSFHLAPTGNGVNTDYDDTKALSPDDPILFMAVTNPKATDSLKVVLTATEIKSGKKVSHTIVFKPIDLPHVPTLKDTTFEVLQGDSLKFSKRFSFLGSLAYDLDGDSIAFTLVDVPEEGEFSDFNEKSGVFTYVAPADHQENIEVHFSMYAYEPKNLESKSETVTFTIRVLDVNDPPTVEVVDDEFDYYVADIDADPLQGKLNDSKKTIDVDEDFTDTIWVEMDPEKIVFADVDNPELAMKVKTDGKVKAKVVAFQGVNYVEVTAKKDANGLAKVTYYADDGEFQKGVNFYLQIAPVDDLPVANDDEYNAVQDSTIKIAVKKGVLANDENPDDPEATLTAKLKENVEHGKLTLSKDGSFKYEADASFRGEVSFTYICVNEAGVESKPATVTIKVAAKNMPPVVRKGIADSLETVLSSLEEDDLLSAKTFRLSVVNSWFEDPDDDPMTFDAVNEDGKLKISVTKSSIVVAPAADSCGSSEVTFIATDSLGAEVKLTVPVQIKPVNDAPVPVAAENARYNVATSDWEMKIDLDTLVFDVDGDSLTYSISKSSSRLDQYLDMKIKGSVFTIKPHKIGLETNKDYIVTIDVKDSKTSVQLILTFATGSTSNIKAVAVQKVNWQGAIAADRGVAAMMDMQGRVMWKAKLPVSEAEVRGAAAAVQGRKVLRVNNQTWTIK